MISNIAYFIVIRLQINLCTELLQFLLPVNLLQKNVFLDLSFQWDKKFYEIVF
jgi:hypothetical protein